MKKKKGSFLVEVKAGEENVVVVTTYGNLEVGQRVILAPEGSTVSGKEVKRQKVAGEWSAGSICGPMEMGCKGDASKAIVLDKSYDVGSFAPAFGGSDGGGGDADGANEEDEEDDRKNKKGKAKATAKAAGKKAKDEDDEEEDAEEEEAPKGKARKESVKGKAKSQEPEDEDSDDDRGKKGKKGKR